MRGERDRNRSGSRGVGWEGWDGPRGYRAAPALRFPSPPAAPEMFPLLWFCGVTQVQGLRWLRSPGPARAGRQVLKLLTGTWAPGDTGSDPAACLEKALGARALPPQPPRRPRPALRGLGGAGGRESHTALCAENMPLLSRKLSQMVWKFD